MATTTAIAGPGFFVGISYEFGEVVGITAKVLSTNKENRAAVAAGVSYFPTIKKIGVDASGAYLFRNGAIALGWDFLNSASQIGLG